MEQKQKNVFYSIKILSLVFLLGLFVFGDIKTCRVFAEDATGDDQEVASDFSLYKKYQLYQKYEKKQKYKKYKKYSKYKEAYDKCKDSLAFKNGLKKCSSSKKNYKKYAKYKKYSKYKKYNKSEYDDYKNYGSDTYKQGYERYVQAIKDGTAVDLGEADLGGDELGPEMSVGIQSYTKSDLQDESFKISGNSEHTFNIKDSEGTILNPLPIDSSAEIRVKYLSDKKFKVYDSNDNTIADSVSDEIVFESVTADDTEMIFDVNKPGSDYDNYRGKIKLRYYDSDSGSSYDRIWVINVIPLEQYVWGIGEITGTGETNYNRTMTTVFRTYGYWKIKYSTKYSDQGFKVDATSGSQIYRGYDWEDDHGRIREAAEDTQGNIVMYDGDIAITPYCSWTDGYTRRYEDGHWGNTCNKSDDYKDKDSSLYPWLDAVKDSYGKHASKDTCALAEEGNHMVGLSAHGALNLAGDDYDWQWRDILGYYYDGVDIAKVYPLK